ncbi:hypothetical protein SODG_006741 [Sodalis praecaptivus]
MTGVRTVMLTMLPLKNGNRKNIGVMRADTTARVTSHSYREDHRGEIISQARLNAILITSWPNCNSVSPYQPDSKKGTG